LELHSFRFFYFYYSYVALATPIDNAYCISYVLSLWPFHQLSLGFSLAVPINCTLPLCPYHIGYVVIPWLFTHPINCSLPPYYTPDQSMSASRLPICSGYLRPWSSPHFLTCDACRLRKRVTRYPPPTNPSPIVPLPILINPDIHSDQRRRLSDSSLGDNYATEAVDRAVHLLQDGFGHREAASQEFPPEISASHIRVSISKYEDEMSAASKTSVCCSCGQLVATAHIHRLNDNSNTIDCLRGCLDTCGRHGDDWELCSPCHSALRRGKFPKFSAKNSINIHYVPALSVRSRRPHSN
jgi:hypothetical protein